MLEKQDSFLEEAEEPDSGRGRGFWGSGAALGNLPAVEREG